MTDDFQRATVQVGVPGLNGGGVTSGDLVTIALGKASSSEAFIVRTASVFLTNEQALDAIAGLPGIAKINADGSLAKAAGSDLPSHNHTGVPFTLQFNLASGAAATALATGARPDLELAIPVACTITDYSLVGTPITGQTSGSAVVDLLSNTHSGYPNTPGGGTSIVGGGAKPTISSNVKNVTNSLTSWTTALSATNFLKPSVISCTNLASLRLTLFCTRSV